MDETQAPELERLVAAGRDALTDEMVSRLSTTAADGWICWTRSSADEMVARMAETVPESLSLTHRLQRAESPHYSRSPRNSGQAACLTRTIAGAHSASTLEEGLAGRVGRNAQADPQNGRGIDRNEGK